jgi:hypothetical protein
MYRKMPVSILGRSPRYRARAKAKARAKENAETRRTQGNAAKDKGKSVTLY